MRNPSETPTPGDSLQSLLYITIDSLQSRGGLFVSFVVLIVNDVAGEGGHLNPNPNPNPDPNPNPNPNPNPDPPDQNVFPPHILVSRLKTRWYRVVRHTEDSGLGGTHLAL